MFASMSDEALSRAVKAAGNRTELAKLLSISPAAVYQWDRVPPLRVLEVERVTGVSRHDLRPDLYPPAPTSDEERAA